MRMNRRTIEQPLVGQDANFDATNILWFTVPGALLVVPSACMWIIKTIHLLKFRTLAGYKKV